MKESICIVYPKGCHLQPIGTQGIFRRRCTLGKVWLAAPFKPGG